MHEDKRATKWFERAEYLDHKPKWVNKIPDVLRELGRVFFPIPRRRKAWRYAHSKPDNRYHPDSEILNAYLEAGWGYGVACAGHLVVVDLDDLDYDEIIDELPDTAKQVTGSRTGVHLFYFCEGLTQRKTLYDTTTEERKHIGEIKCDPHGYVVGPNSVHPSGNEYGPLEGEEITRIDKEDLLDYLDDYIRDKNHQTEFSVRGKDTNATKHDLFSLTANDVAPWLSINERVAHPIHGSETGMNFMKNEHGTFTCWRCQYGTGDGCGINARQLLAMEGADSFGNMPVRDMFCEYVRDKWQTDSRLRYYAWRKAVEEGFIDCLPIPYFAVKGYLVDHDVISEDENPTRKQYVETKQALDYIINAPESPPYKLMD